MLPRSTKLAELRKKIVAHPGSVAKSRWDGLRRMRAIVRGNFQELRLLLDRPSKDMEFALELIQNVRDDSMQRQFGLEIDRLLHNAVAAASTLVDHTRRVVNKYPGSQFEAEYQQHLTQVKSNDVVAFVKDLRNLTLHKRLPYTGHRVSVSMRKETFSYTLELPAEALLEMMSWSAGGRRYLEAAQDGQLSLRQVVDEYEAAIASLYDWLFTQFLPLHDEDLNGANLLIDEYNQLLTGQVDPPKPPF